MFPHRYFALRMFPCRWFLPVPTTPMARVPDACRFTIFCGGPLEVGLAAR
jgi:hypothetical protein